MSEIPPRYSPDGQTMSLAKLHRLRSLYAINNNFTFLSIATDKRGQVELVESGSIEPIKVLLQLDTEGLIVCGSAGEGKSTLMSLLVETSDTVSNENYSWWFVLFDLLLARLRTSLNKPTSRFTTDDWARVDDWADHEDLVGSLELSKKGATKIRKAREFPGVGLVPTEHGVTKLRGWNYVARKATQTGNSQNLLVAVSGSEAVRNEARSQRSLAESMQQTSGPTMNHLLSTLKDKGLRIEQDLQILEEQGYERLDLIQRLGRMLGSSASADFVNLLWKELAQDAEVTQFLLRRHNSPLLKLKDPIAHHLKHKHTEDFEKSSPDQRELWVLVVLHWLVRIHSLGLERPTGFVAVNSFTPDLAKPTVALKVMKAAYSDKHPASSDGY